MDSLPPSEPPLSLTRHWDKKAFLQGLPGGGRKILAAWPWALPSRAQLLVEHLKPVQVWQHACVRLQG